MATTIEPAAAPVTAVRERRARMAHYALWQARDYFFERGLPTVLVSSLFGVLGWMSVRSQVELITAAGRTPTQAWLANANSEVLRNSIGGIVFLGALFAMNGLVSNDRKLGFYRFLFAKPVTPERYYGQAFVVHLVGFMLALVTLTLIWGQVMMPVLSTKLLAASAMVFVCYAGIAFFLSAAARWDWLSLVAFSFLATEAWRWFGDSKSPLAKLLYLLPPLPEADTIYAAAARGNALPWHAMWWLAGYGLVAFVAGLVVLRHRRLAIP
jgi:hypothetical protein